MYLVNSYDNRSRFEMDRWGLNKRDLRNWTEEKHYQTFLCLAPVEAGMSGKSPAHHGTLVNSNYVRQVLVSFTSGIQTNGCMENNVVTSAAQCTKANGKDSNVVDLPLTFKRAVHKFNYSCLYSIASALPHTAAKKGPPWCWGYVNIPN